MLKVSFFVQRLIHAIWKRMSIAERSEFIITHLPTSGYYFSVQIILSHLQAMHLSRPKSNRWQIQVTGKSALIIHVTQILHLKLSQKQWIAAQNPPQKTCSISCRHIHLIWLKGISAISFVDNLSKQISVSQVVGDRLFLMLRKISSRVTGRHSKKGTDLIKSAQAPGRKWLVSWLFKC